MYLNRYLAIVLSLATLSSPIVAETLIYDETSEGKTTRLNWKTEEIAKGNINYELKHAGETTSISGANGTEEWSNYHKRTKTNLKVLRKNNALVIAGRKNGKNIDKTVKIDNEKWMASPGFFLRDFLIFIQFGIIDSCICL